LKSRAHRYGVLAVGCVVCFFGARTITTLLEPPRSDTSERNRGKISDRFPDVRLETQDGETKRFYSDLVRDRKVIVNFMYTTCTGT